MYLIILIEVDINPMICSFLLVSWIFCKVVSILYEIYCVLPSTDICVRLLFNLDRMLLFAKYIPFYQYVVYPSSFHFYTHQSCPCYLQLHSSLYKPVMEFSDGNFFSDALKHYLIRKLQLWWASLIRIIFLTFASMCI